MLKASHKELLFGLGVASVSGILGFTAVADFDIWPFGWMALVPVFFAIERATNVPRALLFGWWAGLVTSAGGFYWITSLLERFGQLPSVIAALLFFLFCAYQGLLFLFFGWAARSIRRSTSLPMALVAPVVMVAFELCIPYVFPWYLAISQAWQIHVIQVADLAGPLGVTALLMMINGAIYDIIIERRRRVVAAAASVIILAAALMYGHLRINQMIEQHAGAPKIKVGIVQPNVALEHKGIESLAGKQLAELQLRSAELEAEGAELIVWPETSFPFPISRRAAGDRSEREPQRIRQGFTAPLFMGAVTYNPDKRDGYPYNTALMLDRSGGFTARYDKIFLLVFGEYIPGLETFPLVRQFMPANVMHFGSGEEIVTFPFETRDNRQWRLGPSICYEDLMPGLGRQLGKMRPHLLVNITNDAWFGDTSEPWEHLALSVFRTVELRTEMVRAVNTGVSAYVDATGKIHARTYLIDPIKHPRGADKILAEVALMEGGHTIYAAVGDLFGYLNLIITLYLWLILPRLRRRKSSGLLKWPFQASLREEDPRYSRRASNTPV